MFGSNLTLFPHTLIAYHARLAHTSVFLKSLVFPPPRISYRTNAK